MIRIMNGGKPPCQGMATAFRWHRQAILWAVIALCMALLAAPGKAQAAVSCSVTPASGINLTATVQNGTTIAAIPESQTPTSIILNCTGDASEVFGNMQTCSAYSALNSVGPYAFTLIRQDGRTNASSQDNHIVVYPLTSTGNEVTSAGTYAGSLQGTATSSSTGSGTSQISMMFNLAAPAGAIVESGVYVGDVSYLLKLIRITGFAGNDACNGTYPYDQVLGTYQTPITVTVPAQCTMTQPSTLDFGQHESLASGVTGVASNFSVTCNNNADKFHVYIDSGANAQSGQRRMKRSGSEEFVPYDLLDGNNVPFATAAIGTPETAGGYTRNTSGLNVAINGRIPAQAGTVRAGTYTDQVVVHVEY